MNYESPLVPLKPDQRYLAAPLAMMLCVAMFTLQVMVPAETTTEILLSMLFWAAMINKLPDRDLKQNSEAEPPSHLQGIANK